MIGCISVSTFDTNEIDPPQVHELKKPIKILQVEVLAQSNRFSVPTSVPLLLKLAIYFLAFILIVGIDCKWQKFSLVKEEHITLRMMTVIVKNVNISSYETP